MSWTITGAQKVNGLLDEFSGAAAAYSLRSLTVLRGDPVVRVRRSSVPSGGDSEKDFRSSEIDSGAMLSWVKENSATANGFVTVWYDQTGNGRDARQANTTLQPRIVNSGAQETKGSGSKPSIRFLGGNYRLETSAFGGWDVDSMFIAASCDSVNKFIIDGGPSSNNLSLWSGITAGDLRFFAGGIGVVEQNLITLGSLSLINTIADSTGTDTLSVNTDTRTGNYVSNKRGGLTIGAAAGGGLGLNDSFSELVIYPFDQSANRSSINANINSYYSIY